MHSKNRTDNQETPGRTFIEQTRRSQIIQATIEMLAEYGYINTSFVRIGKHIGISPSLISYHFKDKDELTRETLRTIFEDRANFVKAEVGKAATFTEKLRTAIEADLAAMGAQPERFQAAAEIMFSYRTDKGAMVYLGDSESGLFHIVHDIIEGGKKAGEFADVDAYMLTVAIEGARDSFLAQLGLKPKFELASFTKTLIELIMQSVTKGMK